MNHSEIIAALEDILPTIKATQDPEGTLLKYASEHNLAPAQLERVVHFYNIAKTNNYLDKSANRAAHYKIINAENVVDKYTASLPAKEISVDAEADAWLSPVSTKQASTSIVDLYREIKGADEEVWDIPTDVYPALNSLGEVHAKLANQITNVETLAQILDDEKSRFTSLAFQMEDWLRSDESHKFATAERDAIALSPDDISEGVGELVNFLGQRHVTADRHEGLLAKLARDTTGMAKIVIEANDAFHAVKAATALYKQDHEEMVELYKEATQGKTRDKKEKAEGDRERPEGRREQARQQPYENVDGGEGVTPDENLWLMENPVSPSQKKDKPREPEKPTSVIDQIQKSLDGLPWVKDHMAPYKSIMGPGGIVDQIRPKQNKGKMLLDQASLDDHANTVLQNLLINDEILSLADPDRVAKLYSTIYRTSPDVALNEEVATMAVREALQYDSLPLHTYKDLADISKSRAEAQRANADLATRRYNI